MKQLLPITENPMVILKLKRGQLKKINIQKSWGVVTFSTTEVAYAMINTVPSSNRSRIDKYVDNKTSINLKKESMNYCIEAWI